jgi:sugar lactone lactonase YvrE
MTITPDGTCVIISLYNPQEAAFGRTIQVRLNDGVIVGEWRTQGSPQATCPQWVNRAGKAVLVITTAVEHMPAERRPGAPKAGALFMVPTEMDWDTTVFGDLTPKFNEA